MMNMREFLNAVANGNLNDEVIAKAHAEIEKMDARNSKRAATPSKTAIANEPIKKALAEALTGEPQTASELGAKVEVSTSKASALLGQMEKAGIAESTEVKVKGKGKVKGYFIH